MGVRSFPSTSGRTVLRRIFFPFVVLQFPRAIRLLFPNLMNLDGLVWVRAVERQLLFRLAAAFRGPLSGYSLILWALVALTLHSVADTFGQLYAVLCRTFRTTSRFTAYGTGDARLFLGEYVVTSCASVWHNNSTLGAVRGDRQALLWGVRGRSRSRHEAAKSAQKTQIPGHETQAKPAV